MSLLLDALNRASKEKQKAAAAASQAQAPQFGAQPVPEATSPRPISIPAPTLKWEEIPHLTSTSTREPEYRAPDALLHPEPPVLMMSVAPEPELELTLVETPSGNSTPVPTASFESVVRVEPARPPEIQPVALVATEPVRKPVLEARVEPAAPAPVVSEPPAPLTPAPSPAAMKEAAPVLTLTPAASTKYVPDEQMAQDIRRAYENPSSDARKGRRRIMALGGLAVGLALAFGSVFLGLWGDPAQWIGGGSLSTIAPQNPVAIEVPAAPVVAVVPADPAEPDALPKEGAPAAAATLPDPAPTAKSAKSVSEARTTPSGKVTAVEPTNTQAVRDVAPAVSSKAGPASTGNEVVLSGNTRANPNFVAKTRGPSALEQGYALLLEGRMDDAAVAYGQALRANADERDALLGMAYISQKKGQREDAQSYYRRVLRQEPNNARALAGLQALDSGSDATLTASRASDLAARQPDSAAAMAMAGNAFVRDGLVSNAAQAYARAQALEPNNPLHAYNHAVALDRLGRFAAAIVQYERVLSLSVTAPAGERPYRVEDVRLRLAQLRQGLDATESTAP